MSGKTVTVPAGIYDDAVSKSVADGSVTPSATVSGGVLGDTASDYAVTVQPQASVSAGYVTGAQTASPVVKYIQTEEKTVTPATTAQDIFASVGKLIHKIRVLAVDLTATATEADVLNGKTFLPGHSQDAQAAQAYRRYHRIQ